MIKGLHHNAYRCRDSEETRGFYEDFLGLRFVSAFEIDERRGLHSFFEMDDGSCLAFFEVPGRPFDFKRQDTLDLHIALGVDPEVFDNMLRNARNEGVEVRGPDPVSQLPPDSKPFEVVLRHGRMTRNRLNSRSLIGITVIACHSGRSDDRLPAFPQLYAGYCKGVVDARIESMQQQPGMDEMRNTAIQQRQRFEDYLLSTVAIGNANRGTTITGVFAAMQRGRGDLQRCWIALKNCTQVPDGSRADAACGRTPTDNDALRYRPVTPAERKCMDDQINTCLAKEPACARQWRCGKPDNLPF